MKLFALARIELQAFGIDTETHARGCLRRVIENMAKVAAATRARNFYPVHAVTIVFCQFHRVRTYYVIKARPARAAIKLCAAGKKLALADRTDIRSVLFVMKKFAAKRRLRAPLTQDMVLLWCQLFLDLFFTQLPSHYIFSGASMPNRLRPFFKV